MSSCSILSCGYFLCPHMHGKYNLREPFCRYLSGDILEYLGFKVYGMVNGQKVFDDIY